jgi:hypothetical protein
VVGDRGVIHRGHATAIARAGLRAAAQSTPGRPPDVRQRTDARRARAQDSRSPPVRGVAPCFIPSPSSSSSSGCSGS